MFTLKYYFCFRSILESYSIMFPSDKLLLDHKTTEDDRFNKLKVIMNDP